MARAVLLAGVGLLVVSVLLAHGAGATEGTFLTSSPDVPPPSECAVEPRNPMEVAALLASGAAGTPVPTPPEGGLPTTVDAEDLLPQGAPADPATTTAVATAIRLFVACLNADAPSPVVFALFTDRMLQGIGAASATEETPPPSQADIATQIAQETPAPKPEWDRTPMPLVRDVRLLSGDRVGAIVEEQRLGHLFVVFVEQGGRLRIDDVVEVQLPPTDACGLLTRAEAEAIVGALAEDPAPLGIPYDCRYTLTAAAAARQGIDTTFSLKVQTASELEVDDLAEAFDAQTAVLLASDYAQPVADLGIRAAYDPAIRFLWVLTNRHLVVVSDLPLSLARAVAQRVLTNIPRVVPGGACQLVDRATAEAVVGPLGDDPWSSPDDPTVCIYAPANVNAPVIDLELYASASLDTDRAGLTAVFADNVAALAAFGPTQLILDLGDQAVFGAAAVDPQLWVLSGDSVLVVHGLPVDQARAFAAQALSTLATL
jgi:hypothetical protein